MPVSAHEPGTVTLTLPAETSYVAVARSLAAAMAARADLAIDHLEDVRLAVDEAVSQLVRDADGTVTVSFTVLPDGLAIEVAARTGATAPPETGTFGWTVLAALADEVRATAVDGTVTITLQVTRREPASA